MTRNSIRIYGINFKWVVLAAIYPFIYWALYQDMKAELPWYYIVLACLAGTVLGLFLIIKIVDPAMRYVDNKIGKLLNITE